MPRMTKHKVTENGWTYWIKPHMRLYRMGCCDCGLVHDLQFVVVKSGRGHAVVFRARRNNRSTAAIRKNWQVRDETNVCKGTK